MTDPHSLTAEESKELATLVAEATAAKDRVLEWLDAKMLEKASVKPGEMLYDLSSKVAVGIVTELYRDPEDRFSFSINYRYHANWDEKTTITYIDNTSRHGGSWKFGSKAQLVARMKRDASINLALAERMESE
jgi:hypothetical protein